MEVKFDVVRPNLYFVGDNIYFGIDPSDVIPVSRTIDEVVGKHIGVLKVQKFDFEAIVSGKAEKSATGYDTLLSRYLNAVAEKNPTHFGITSSEANLFGLRYIIDAQTQEETRSIHEWRNLQRGLVNPDDTFDRMERDSPVILDRERTLEKMRKLYQELDSKMPENYADLFITVGELPAAEHNLKLQYVGRIILAQVKAGDESKIEEAKADLVEKLKEVEGPCLSFGTPQLLQQMASLYVNASELIRNYGDVLKFPNWRTRFFSLDP